MPQSHSDCSVESAIQAVQRGEIERYTAVVDEYQARLRAAVGARSPVGVDADEIAHRAFVEAFAAISRYTPGTDFFAWLVTIARNLLRNELRKRSREARRSAGYRDLKRALEAAAEADELAEERLAALRTCVEELPEGRRALLTDRYDESRPLAEIARELGTTLGAIKSRLHATREALRRCVRGKLAPEGAR